uniref:2-succinyl-6-hydroxy-2,4-cyclohexadiene-1-carboxylate synthase n=1 Tax=uncultured Chloroflexota bacterium TaxID=166587 RepID=H5SM18_9CHLR|nr:2-succinyl-6-hydroxy-2,4-cyclohexadiene-1-carboxylate synthase [uncultured Chloroflexota bacterium]
MNATIWSFRAFGEAGHTPVVLLHGYLGSSESWAGVALSLADSFYCLLPDLPGHGENSMRLGRWPSLGQWASQLNAFLEAQGLERVHLVGYSLGGRLALRFALEFPQRLLSLALESASPGLRAWGERAARRKLDRERAQELYRGEKRAFLEKWYRQDIFGFLNEAQRERLIQAGWGRDMRKMALIIQCLSPGREPSLWDSLARLTMPVLLIGGGEDRIYHKIMEEMAQAIPKAHLRFFQGAGHNVHAFFPEEVASLLREFFLGLL